MLKGAVTNNGTLELRGGTMTQAITNNGEIIIEKDTTLLSLTGTGTVSNNMTLTGVTNTNTINGSGRIIIDSTGFETTGALNQAIRINAGKMVTAAANLIGGAVTNNGTLYLNAGTLSHPVYGGTTQIIAAQTVTANASMATTAIVNNGILNIGFANLFGDVLSDDGSENNGAASELHVNGDGVVTRSITGAGTTYLNGNVTMAEGTVELGKTVLESGSLSVEANSVVNGDLTLNGNLKMELYDIAAGIGITADYDVYTTAMNLTGGYDFDNGITPEGGLRFNRVTRRSYRDSAGQHMSKDNMNLTTLVAGSRFGKAFKHGDFEWTASATAALTCDLASDRANFIAAVGNSVYSVEGRRMSRMGGEAGVGAQTSYKDWDFSLKAEYNF